MFHDNARSDEAPFGYQQGVARGHAVPVADGGVQNEQGLGKNSLNRPLPGF